MAMMTTYDDREVNALVGRIELVSDEGVPTLCCRIDVTLASGEDLSRYENMTTENFDFNRATISELIRRIGAETSVPTGAYDLLEGFVDDLPDGSVADVVEAFAQSPRQRLSP